MKLLFRQRIFSWLDSYDVYDEDEKVLFTVKGIPALKHCFKIYDHAGSQVGTIRERLLSFLCPRFDLEIQGVNAGCIVKELSLFQPHFTLELYDWQVRGDWLEWNYQITSSRGEIATISKRLFNWSDTYEIDVRDPQDALATLMVVIAIDAVKCSNRK